MISQLRSILRDLPIVSPAWRSFRRAFFPNRYDRWRFHQQRFHDYLGYVTRSEREPVFVKVGANDGLSGDPCGRLFLDSLNWRGLLIEPVPYLFAKLSENYADRKRFLVEKVAIGQKPGKTHFFYVDPAAVKAHPELPAHYDMLGSFNRQHIVDHLDGILEPFIVEEEIEVDSLTNILEKHSVRNIELLQIAVEGFDWEVLQSLDFDRLRPRAIYIEHKHLSPADLMALRTKLLSHDFSLYDCGNDYFAV